MWHLHTLKGHSLPATHRIRTKTTLLTWPSMTWMMSQSSLMWRTKIIYSWLDPNILSDSLKLYLSDCGGCAWHLGLWQENSLAEAHDAVMVKAYMCLCVFTCFDDIASHDQHRLKILILVILLNLMRFPCRTWMSESQPLHHFMHVHINEHTWPRRTLCQLMGWWQMRWCWLALSCLTTEVCTHYFYHVCIKLTASLHSLELESEICAFKRKWHVWYFPLPLSQKRTTWPMTPRDDTSGLVLGNA